MRAVCRASYRNAVYACAYIHSYIHTDIHAYIRIHRELELLRRVVNSSADCLPCRSHSAVRRTVEMSRLLHLCNSWAGQADNPRYSAIKTEEITRKLLCLVKKWGHCPITYSENQYWMTTHLDINFMIAYADFLLFEDREVEKTATLCFTAQRKRRHFIVYEYSVSIDMAQF